MEWKLTNTQTDTTDLIAVPANAVGKADFSFYSF